MARESKRNRDLKRFGGRGRLADRIFRGPPTWMKRAEQKDEHMEEYWRCMSDAQGSRNDWSVVDAQNVFDYAEFHYKDRKADLKDIPFWVSPFPAVFIEFQSLHPKIGFGILFLQETGEDGNCDVNGYCFLEISDRVVGPVAISRHKAHPDGARGNDDEASITFVGGYEDDDEVSKLIQQTVGVSYFCALLTLSFMHCKNVSVSSVDPDPAINRERRKAGLKPFLRYHTINIEPMKRVLRTEGGIETNGLGRALHFCRGHFATYTEENPLFGRTTGTFWVPAHVRGSIKEGVVVSDYKVNPPQPQGYRSWATNTATTRG